MARLARQKAADVAEQLRCPAGAGEANYAAGPIVACDTVAECQGQVLGKPTHRDDARRMLELLSGREHRVYSGLCVWPLDGGQSHVRVARTTLLMDRLGDAEIDEYLASGLWEGKAGAFGYQDRVGWLRIVEGAASNVVGLPLELLEEMLAESQSPQQNESPLE